jgi:hypothetical protein
MGTDHDELTMSKLSSNISLRLTFGREPPA